MYNDIEQLAERLTVLEDEVAGLLRVVADLEQMIEALDADATEA